MKNNSHVFSERLRKLRGDKSKAVFASEIGIENPSTYHYYEAGRVPSAAILERIANSRGVTVDWLLGGEEKMTNTKVVLQPGWEERLIYWIKQYAKATEVLVNKHGKSLHDAIEPAFVVFIEEQEKKREVKS